MVGVFIDRPGCQLEHVIRQGALVQVFQHSEGVWPHHRQERVGGPVEHLHGRDVRLGIIAFETQYATSPWHGFWMYDNERVLVETFSAALDLRQPQEIELYGNAFEQLAAVAGYSRSARGIINRAIDDLAPEVPEDGT